MEKRHTDIYSFVNSELPKLNMSLKDLWDRISWVNRVSVSDATATPTGGSNGELRLQDDGTNEVLWVYCVDEWINVGDLISTIIDHTHSSTAGEGGQLDWDDVWSDAVHSHQSDAEGGTIKLDDWAAPDDNTDLDASTSAHGLCPKGDNNAANFLRGDLTWATPPGVAPGSDTQIIFNDGGSFGADADFVWDKTNNRLGIGEASPLTSIEVTDNAPYITIHNDTHQDNAGGRESRIYFRGEKSDGTEHILGYLEIAHSGGGNDKKGCLTFYLNDGTTETQRFYMLSDGETRLTGEFIINYNGFGGTAGVALEVNHNTLPYVWLTNLNPEDSDEGRETRILFRGVGTGFQYDDTLAMIEGNHDGSAGDQKGNLLFCTNDGNDNDAPTERMRIDSDGDVTINGGELQFNDANTQIWEDGSGNLSFKDANAGTLTLSQLNSPKEIHIYATGQSAGSLHLSDGTNWATSKAKIYSIRVITDCDDWDMWLIRNDNGRVTDDADYKALQIMDNGSGNSRIVINDSYIDEDSSDEVHLDLVDNEGGQTFDIYINGEPMR